MAITNYGMKSCGLDGRTFLSPHKSKLELQTYGLLHTRNFLYHVLAFRALFINMSNKIDYSKYECPYSHLEKECGHELHSPEGYQDVYSVWCQCGFRAPVFYLDPEQLGLKLKNSDDVSWHER